MVPVSSPVFNEYLVIVAIDFGTSYSGYAYSWTADKDICQNRPWPNETYYKTSTRLLLKKNDLSILSFGTDARNKFFAEESNGDMLLFENFKMSLFIDSSSSRTDIVRAVNSNVEVSVKILIQKSLEYLKTCALEEINLGAATPVSPEKILWIVTIPAIWDNAARKAMTDAAIRAQITPDGKKGFYIALEPEAASIYCSTSLSLNLPPRSKYMIIDAGGGTIDITCHEVLEDTFLKEIIPASGGPWGSTYVNQNFLEFLKCLFDGVETKNEEKEKSKVPFRFDSLINTPEFFLILDEFESVKRACKWDENDSVEKLVNIGLITGEFDTSTLDVIQKKWAAEKPEWKFRISKGIMRISQCLIRNLFFYPLFNKIESHVDGLLQHPGLCGSTDFYIFLVGGFAMSNLLQNFLIKKYNGRKLKDSSQEIKVLIPPRPGFSILEGAVHYGYNPKTITSRVSPVTIGVRMVVPFDPAHHCLSNNVIYAGKSFCENVFDSFIRKGEEVDRDKTIQRTYTAIHPQQLIIELEIVVANKPKVNYTTEPGVKTIGFLYLTIPEMGLPNEKRIVDINVKFGGVCVEVEAKYCKTGAKVMSELKFDLDHNQVLQSRRITKEITVDLAFCMDCTGSMKNWIAEAKTRVVSIANEMKSQYSRMKLRIAFVAYRDIKDVIPPRLEVKEFTSDFNSIEKFIGGLVASGGDDTPEDVFGGLESVLSLNWESNERLIIHIADAPCHGQRFHSVYDDFPDGDPNKLSHKDILPRFKENNIDYHFIKINDSTDKMIQIFGKYYDDPQKKIIIHSLADDVSKLTPTVVNCVSTSLTPYIPII